MGLSGIELHHVGVRTQPQLVDETMQLYVDVLGLVPDPGTRRIEGIPGTWLDAANDAQVHLFGVDGVSDYAASPDQDPFTPHIAFGVPSVEEALGELDGSGVAYWTAGRGERQQIFLKDASGNMVELHQIGTCRCVRRRREDVRDIRTAD